MHQGRKQEWRQEHNQTQNRLWEHTCDIPKFPSLHGDVKTDVLIIGGGAAGLLTAYFLKKKGVDCIVAEGNRILSGTTGGTTAKITIQHGLIYGKLIKTFGMEKAKMYFEANRRAGEMFYELSKLYPCDYEKKNNYVYLRSDHKKLEAEAMAVRKLGFSAEITDSLPLPFETAGAVKFPNQAQFNPTKLFSRIAKELNVYEKTFVRELKPNAAITGSGTIKAQKIIIATHFPILNKHGGFFLKMYQSRSYVLGLSNAAKYEGMYVDGEENGFSFRNQGNLLLLGGGGHRTGKNGGNWQELKQFADRYYPNSTERYRWAAQDCMTLDGMPYAGAYSSGTTGLYTATGFNKWGMTSSMASAMLLSDVVMGTGNKYAKLFSPSRSILHPQLFANIGEAAINLMGFSKKRCPHMGCRLKWNRTEHSWDCPCHGSRFSEEGLLLDNPATGNINFYTNTQIRKTQT